MNTITLKDFQIDGVNKMKEYEENDGIGCVLAFQMGLGKTLTMSWFLINQRDIEKPEQPDLIVVPLCVLNQWKSEMLRIKSDMNIFIYHGANRKEKLKKEKPDVVVTTYYSLVTRELEKYQWNRVILDEAHMIRNGTDSKYKTIPKRVIGAYAMARISRFRYCITGTPYNNRQEDVLSLMKFIGYDGSVCDFISKYVIQKSKEDIMEPIKVDKILIENPKDNDIEDYKDLACLYNRVIAQISNTKNIKKLQELHKQAIKILARLRLYCDIMRADSKHYIEIEEEIDENEDDTEEKEDKKKKYQQIEFSKEEKLNFYNSSIKIRTVYEKAVNDIKKVPHNRIIIFSAFTTTLGILETILNEINPEIKTFQYIGKRTKNEREEIIKSFTNIDDKTPMILLMTLGAGSCGLNLVPCSTVILADVSLNPFDEFQAINRVHRITQTNKVNVYKFYMKDMIEEKILKSHDFKIEEAKSVGLVIA